MRYRQPRRILQQIVLAGLPVAAAGCVEAVIDTDCVDTVDRTFTVEMQMADPPLQFVINGCRSDRDNCTALCKETLQRNNIGDNPTACKVVFESDGTVKIDVSYEVFSGGSGCDVVADPEFLTAFATSSGTDLVSSVLGLPVGPQVRGLYARTFDSFWNGGRTCHA